MIFLGELAIAWVSKRFHRHVCLVCLLAFIVNESEPATHPGSGHLQGEEVRFAHHQHTAIHNIKLHNLYPGALLFPRSDGLHTLQGGNGISDRSGHNGLWFTPGRLDLR